MSLEYERKKYQVMKEMVAAYKKDLLEDREHALAMPIETEDGFNIERETILNDIDDKMLILKRHMTEPYFAKLQFTDKEDNTEFFGYIGRLSIGDISTPTDDKIVDWRAPISDLYYNGRLGDTEYTAHGKEYKVDLKLKRQIDIKDDKVNSIYDFEDAISNDEFLKPYLTQSADNRLKSIVATIQEEQNSIIRLPLYQNCIVQGVAGSGKTTVALHRISYLMYNYKKSVKPEEFLIISPNEIFTSYISSILVDLDADKANSYPINKVFESLISSDYKILPKHSQYSYLSHNNISTDYLGFKNNRNFKRILDRYLDDYKKSIFYKPLVIDGIEALDRDTVYSYFSEPIHTNLEDYTTKCCKKLALALCYEDRLKNMAFKNINLSDKHLQKKLQAKRKVESNNIGFIKKNFNFKINPIKTYIDFISHLDKYCDYQDIDILKKHTLSNIKKGILAYDDLAPLLYIISNLIDTPYYYSIKNIFIDEAQDLSELMYIALRRVFKNATFAIFGDIAQGIYGYQSITKWDDIFDDIGDTKMLYLNRSYRTSIEIMEDANKTLLALNEKPANNVVRHGDKVDYIYSNDISTIEKILNDNKDKYSHTAIICKDDVELSIAEKNLAPLNLTVLDETNISYDNNDNILLTVQTAKGLEFDAVIIYDATSFTDSVIDLKLLYVAKTRALHKLCICHKQ